MRISQNLFDYGETGIVAVSTCHSHYGPVSARDFGHAVLWREGGSTDLVDICSRPVDLHAQKQAMAVLRGKFASAATHVHTQLDWVEAHFSRTYRELPSYATQLGGNLLLLGFVGAIEPRVWRLVDLATRCVVWESDPDMAAVAASGIASKWDAAAFLSDSQMPLAAGADFVEIQRGMSRIVFVLDAGRLVPAEWSLSTPNYADNSGMRSGILSQRDSNQNAYALIDPRTGETLKSLCAPTRSKGLSRPATTPGCDRIAISHDGGTVDIVDGLGDAHFSIRPFAQIARTEQLSVCLSNDGEWLGADAWHVFRIVNLSRHEVAELPVPEPNMQDDPERVVYDRRVLATGYGVALMDPFGLSVIPHADLRWRPVAQPAHAAGRKVGVAGKQFARWRKPALALKPAKQGRSFLYGPTGLPSGEVPHHQGRPMQLLACIDLEEAASVLPDSPWPKQGALYFFTAVDAQGAPLVDDMFNLAATRVIHRVGLPVAGEDQAELAARQPLELVPHAADLPDIGAAIVEAAALDDTELESYREWLETRGIADQPAGHRLGGYPTVLQRNDLEAQAALLGTSVHHPPRDLAETSAAARWRLLLQLDSDDACMWGTDSGMLYFLIHQDDLERGDFSRVVSVCQGH